MALFISSIQVLTTRLEPSTINGKIYPPFFNANITVVATSIRHDGHGFLLHYLALILLCFVFFFMRSIIIAEVLNIRLDKRIQTALADIYFIV